jgi:beta-lactamase regulating signal transducer with metallopeptidase domain
MMSLALSTVLLALAWFTIANLTVSLLAWGVAVTALRSRASRHRPGVLLAVRLLPAGAAFLIALVLFVPAHWMTEPRDARETFGWALWAMAALGAALIVRGVLRTAALARADRRLRSRERGSVVLPDVREVEGVPGIALAGLVRTRIVMGEHVAASLTAAELDVAIAHEFAHRGAVDNLKRWAIYCAPDFFGATAIAKATERAWHAAAESLADARAVGGDAQRAVDLASALVKVARLGVEMPRLDSAVWSTFNDPALLKHRVQQLTSGAPAAARSRPLRAAGAALTLIAGAAMLVPVLSGTIHTVTEAAVAFLP